MTENEEPKQAGAPSFAVAWGWTWRVLVCCLIIGAIFAVISGTFNTVAEGQREESEHMQLMARPIVDTKKAQKAADKEIERVDRDYKAWQDSHVEPVESPVSAHEIASIVEGTASHRWTFKAGGRFSAYAVSVEGANLMVTNEAGTPFSLAINQLIESDQRIVSHLIRAKAFERQLDSAPR